MIVFFKRYLPFVAALLLTALWAGCDNNEDPIEDEPFFEMQVSGDVSEELTGPQAQFATFTDADVEESGVILELVTQDQRGMGLTGRFEEVPGEGTYDILLLDEDDFEEDETPFASLEEGELFGVFVTLDEEGATARYTSVSGFLDVHSSDEEWLEGSFEFTATLEDDEEEGEEAPEVSVQGDFLARRGQAQ